MTEGNGTGPAEGSTPSVLQKGVRVLHAFSVTEPQLSVTEIARRVDMHKSTVSRTLSQLEDMELVARIPDSGHFQLGLGLIGLAGPLLANLDVRRVAYPALERLTEQTWETSALTVWTGNASVSVEEIAGPQQVKHTSPIGTRYATVDSASVRVLLAAMTDTTVREFLEDRIDTEAEVATYVDRIGKERVAGCAVNAGDTSVAEVGISAPVHDHRGNTVAAVLLSAPSFRVSEQLRPQLADAVRAAAADTSARLGASPGANGSGPR